VTVVGERRGVSPPVILNRRADAAPFAKKLFATPLTPVRLGRGAVAGDNTLDSPGGLPMSALLTPPMPVSPPAPKLLSADEFFEQYGAGGYELIDGIVTEVSMPGFKHGKVVIKVGVELELYLRDNPIGHAAGNDTLFQLRRGPDTLRGPDVLFVSYAKQPADDVPDGPLKVIPELVFEVRSPSDPWTEVLEKVLDYLKAGVSVVVVLDPKTSTASVFRPNDLQDIFAADQTLTIPDVLPGFAVAVGTLFG